MDPSEPVRPGRGLRLHRPWPRPSLSWPQRRRRPWEEPLRLLLTLAWAVGLTLFGFEQYVFLAAETGWGEGLVKASMLSRTLPHFWVLGLLPAVGFAAAWYAFSWLPLSPWRAVDATAGFLRSRVLMLFTVALYFGPLTYRILFCVLNTGTGDGLASRPVLRLHGMLDYGAPVRRVLGLLEAVAVLGTFLLLMESCFLARRLGARPRNLLALLAVVLAGGMLLPALGRYPFPTPAAVHALRSIEGWPPEERALVRGGTSGGDFQRLEHLYYDTWTDDGWRRPGQIRQLRDFLEPPELLSPLGAFDPFFCSTVLLPYIRVLSATGLTLDLSDEPIRADGPTLVVEVPAGGEIRLYGTEGDPRVVPRGGLHTAFPSTDWIVLKADTRLPAATMTGLLEDLRDAGVRRVSLAAQSVGWSPVGGRVLRLLVTEPGDLPRYEPDRWRSWVIYVPRIPEPGLHCRWDHRRDVRGDENDFGIPVPGELGPEVAVASDRSYQDLVRRLAGAMAARVTTVRVQPPDADAKDPD